MKYKFIMVRYVRFLVRNDSERVEYGIQNFIVSSGLQYKKGVKGLYMV